MIWLTYSRFNIVHCIDNTRWRIKHTLNIWWIVRWNTDIQQLKYILNISNFSSHVVWLEIKKIIVKKKHTLSKIVAHQNRKLDFPFIFYLVTAHLYWVADSIYNPFILLLLWTLNKRPLVWWPANLSFVPISKITENVSPKNLTFSHLF